MIYPHMTGLGDAPCGSGMYAVYSDAAGHFDASVTPVCKPCPTQQADPLFPNGCPTGFTLQPYSGPLGGCTEYSCKDANGKGPIQAQSCGPDLIPWALIGSGIAAIIMLDGWWVLLGIPLLAAGALEGIGYHMQAEIDPTTGQVTCKRAVTSW